jgi:4-amino-4-deoxy-L-arabinose transferase-like glycosyltransferase
MKKFQHVLAFFFILLFFFLNSTTLKPGHNWGGDFSQYILHAQNILNFRSYTEGIMLDLPVVYPPGFPLILAPVIYMWGVDWIILKALNVAFWLFTVCILYGYFHRRFDWVIAAGSSLMLVFSYDLFIFKQNVLSDIPFMFFVLASLVAFQKSEENKGHVWRIATLILMSAALLIRSAGGALFVSTILYYALKRNWKNVIGVIVVFVLTLGLSLSWTGFHRGFFDKFSTQSFYSLESFLHNAHFPWRSLVQFFFPYQAILSDRPYNMFDQWIVCSAFAAYGLIIFLLVKNFLRRQITAWDCFILAYGGLLLFWSGTPIPRDGFERLIFPFVPPFIIWIVTASHQFVRSHPWARVLGMGLIVFCLLVNGMSIKKNGHFNDDVLLQKENQDLFAWLKENVSQDDHYMFWEPRVLNLMTGRLGTSWWIFPKEETINLPERIKKFDIQYLITIKEFDQNFIQAFEANPAFYKAVWENKNYKVFKILY